jgi:hypothetical protein
MRAFAPPATTDHIDTATAAGRMLYAVLGAVAQFEHDALRERTVAGMRAAKRRGEHIAVRRPFHQRRFGRPRRCLIAARVRTTSRGSCVSADLRCTAIWHSDGSAACATLHRPFKYVLGGPEREQAREQAVASQPKTAAKLTNRIS